MANHLWREPYDLWAYCRMSGFTREDLSGRHIQDLAALEAPGETFGRIEAIAQHGFDRFESRHRRRDGTAMDVEISASHLRSAGHCLMVIRDITEQRRAQEAVRAERRRFNDILDTLPGHLVLLTPDYEIAFANRFFRERFGEAGGRRCFEHLCGLTRPCEVCEPFNALETMQAQERVWTGPDGSHYCVYDFPFIDSDGSTLLLEARIDVTDLKQAEAAVRRLNATLEQRVAERTAALKAVNLELEAFSYSVSHDLRGPLRAIGGFAEALREDYAQCLDEAGRGYLKRPRDAVLRMNELIDGMLGLSRIARSSLTWTPVDLSALARGIASDLSACDPRRVVSWDIEPGLMVNGDQTLLRALLQNLLGNAWKFTARRERGRITSAVDGSTEGTYFTSATMAPASKWPMRTGCSSLSSVCTAMPNTRGAASGLRRYGGSSSATEARCGAKANPARERPFYSLAMQVTPGL